MSFCGLSSVASAGRMLYAFCARRRHARVGLAQEGLASYRTPANSLTAMVVGAFILALVAFLAGGGTAIVIVTAISTIFLYAAYGICIYLGATTREWLEHRVWSLGRFSKPIAWVAIFWVIVLMVLFSFPTSGNISITFMLVVVVLLAIYYFASAKRTFKGPRIMGDATALTEIEREFDHAAEDISGPRPG